MIQISGGKSALWWEQKRQMSGGKSDKLGGGKSNKGKWTTTTPLHQGFSDFGTLMTMLTAKVVWNKSRRISSISDVELAY